MIMVKENSKYNMKMYIKGINYNNIRSQKDKYEAKKWKSIAQGKFPKEHR